MFKKFGLVVFFFLLALPSIAAPGDFEAHIQDIEQRLDRTIVLYQNGDIDQAKREVQMAYFEVFENLEGPIRINISAKKSFEMEAVFGEIRRMIIDHKSLEDVQARVNWLKAELRAVQPAIEQGHTLSAQGAHGIYDNEKIDPYWRVNFEQIDDLLADAIALYQEGKFTEARENIRRAQFDGFKNSELEIAVRLNRSSAKSQAINQAFTRIYALAEKPGQITELGYQITLLLQDLEVTMENLPMPPKAAQALAAMMADDAVQGTDNNWNQVTGDINAAIAAAIAQYEAGQVREAISAVQDAYFDYFEASGMENRIGARDIGMKTRMEGFFTRIVGLMKAGHPVSEIQEQAQSLSNDLAAASELLGGQNQTVWDKVLMSLIIILREGLEALLIVTAIVAYLVKNKHQDKLPLIRQSVIAALVASFLTAGAFYWLFANAGAQRELLEGFTMMIAVVVLFFMSYWLISKAEAEHWKEYLEKQISSSLTKGSLAGLWFASFLAVYREGAETVLFYQALLIDANNMADYMALAAGFVIGCILLTVVYFLMRFSVVRLPLRPFFLFTGGFMYLMAFIFAGKSVLELIEGKLFEPTLWSWVPRNGFLELLGIYPYRETLLPQIVLIIAAIIGLIIMKRRRPPAALAGAKVIHS